tara:strand:+ start:330 stop:1007 length:678 start_codon:yes stop_codon:yes gene_type:complete
VINNFYKRIITSLFLTLILCFGLFYNDYSWKALVIILSFLCLYEFYNLINNIYKNKIIIIILFVLVSFYFFFFSSLLIRLKIEFGEEMILILIISCIFSDIGGYIVGKSVGGPKLTSISPNKTISGAFGSIIFTIIGTSLFLIYLNNVEENKFELKFSVSFCIWLVVMSILCQLGDLIISYLKRRANIKDTGNILPGHGGILDRVDGIIFAIPIGILIYFFLGLS